MGLEHDWHDVVCDARKLEEVFADQRIQALVDAQDCCASAHLRKFGGDWAELICSHIYTGWGLPPYERIAKEFCCAHLDILGDPKPNNV